MNVTWREWKREFRRRLEGRRLPCFALVLAKVLVMDGMGLLLWMALFQKGLVFLFLVPVVWLLGHLVDFGYHRWALQIWRGESWRWTTLASGFGRIHPAWVWLAGRGWVTASLWSTMVMTNILLFLVGFFGGNSGITIQLLNLAVILLFSSLVFFWFCGTALLPLAMMDDRPPRLGETLGRVVQATRGKMGRLCRMELSLLRWHLLKWILGVGVAAVIIKLGIGHFLFLIATVWDKLFRLWVDWEILVQSVLQTNPLEVLRFLLQIPWESLPQMAWEQFLLNVLRPLGILGNIPMIFLGALVAGWLVTLPIRAWIQLSRLMFRARLYQGEGEEWHQEQKEVKSSSSIGQKMDVEEETIHV